MVTLILGKKGSGKTKKLMDLCNQAVQNSKGNVVFIEKDNTLTYDVSHQVRLVSAADYGICGFESLYGFVAGMCAGNYDITDIFVDSTLKIGGTDMAELDAFVEKISKLNIRTVMSVSADKEEIPAHIAQIAEEI
jgi:ABC-type phosphonate transport system ATPase subunit